jgi:methyl-accepting chemotaxis protein
MKIKQKMLLGFGGLSFLILTAMGLFLYFFTRDQIARDTDLEFKKNVELLYEDINTYVNASIRNHLRAIAQKNTDIARHFYSLYQQGKLSEQEAKERFSQVLLSQKVGETGYLFVLNIENAPQSIIAEIHPAIPGREVSNFDFVREAAKIKEGYFEYDWKNPGEETARKKDMAVSYFQPWNWVISASSYHEEFHNLIHLDDLRSTFKKIKIGKTGYAALLNSKGEVLIHPDDALVGKNLYNTKDEDGKLFIQKALEMKNGNINYNWKTPGEDEAQARFGYFRYIPQMDWLVWITSYQDEFFDLAYTIRNLLILGILASLAGLFLLTSGISSKLTKPIIRIKDMLMEISQGKGDLTQTLKIDTKDELGDLAAYFNEFMTHQKEMIRELKKRSNELSHASTELASNAEESASSVQEISASAKNVNTSMRKQNDMVDESNNYLAKILGSISQITEQAENTKEQISEASSAIEEMAATIASSSQLAVKGDQAANNLNEVSEEGQKPWIRSWKPLKPFPRIQIKFRKWCSLSWTSPNRPTFWP